MKKFRYSMQDILDMQYRLESLAKAEYAVAQSALNEEKHKLEIINEHQRQYEECLRKLVSGRLDFKEIAFTETAIEQKKEDAKQQQKNIVMAEKALDKAREKLNQVRVERKTHELLKEKALEQYMAELNREEATETDELVSYRYNGSKDE